MYDVNNIGEDIAGDVEEWRVVINVSGKGCGNIAKRNVGETLTTTSPGTFTFTPAVGHAVQIYCLTFSEKK